ncbi:MAG: HAD hydrolase-like protein [Kofleriaceae bacterium]|nr:HAD hydrolase-like protein [Kofleriaceae bacterium]
MDIPPRQAAPREISMRELLNEYTSVLLDAYGVLVNADGALPHAVALIDELNRTATPYCIVTNDASRSPATCAARFAALGLAIPAACITTAGDLIADYFATHRLAGARTLVLGTDDSRDYIRHTDGEIVPIAPGLDVDVIAVCDDAGFPFLAGAEIALSAAIRSLDAGRPVHLLLPNPDIVYPKSTTEMGFTAGAIALMIETALARRYPQSPPQFARLGKPAPALLRRGAARIGGRPIMIGDQLETDIAAACAATIPCALIAGVSRWSAQRTDGMVPNYGLGSLAL